MTKYSEKEIKNILLRANSAKLEQLLQLCLDPDSGITVEALRNANYNKIDQLEQRYGMLREEEDWKHAQDNLEKLNRFIDRINAGMYSSVHLEEAIDRRKYFAAQLEEKEWLSVRNSGDRQKLENFYRYCIQGIYSNRHQEEAQLLIEQLDWEKAKASRNPVEMNSYIQNCKGGLYRTNHLKEAYELLEEWANGTIQEEWTKILSLSNTDPQKLMLVNEFIDKYDLSPSKLAQEYVPKAKEMIETVKDAESARKDWIAAQSQNSILAYADFLQKHPYSEYREEALQTIQNLKGNLLSDMKRYAFKYNREVMYHYIYTKALTMEDLVNNSYVLTDRAYNHIKQYPTLQSEQRKLPVSTLANPRSMEGNTDIYFFGVSGSGKTCVLAGLMSLTGQLGFSFDPKGPGGGGNYAMELRNYARKSMLPPQTDQSYIQVIDAEINDVEGHLHKISLIEMSGEKTHEFASMNNPTSLEDLGPGAAGLLSNDNSKVIFFVIDPTSNEKDIFLGENKDIIVKQSDVLDCVSSLLAKNSSLMKKVVAVHVILTKSDTLGDSVDQNVIQNILDQQGYKAVLGRIKSLCEKYNINKPTGFQVGLFPFCVGHFMPGEVYTFDETDSLKLLRVIQKNTGSVKQKGGFFDPIVKWFNS